ncbi:YdcH family protein [Novosphingobium sp.]|uniref:YdcH family protein n=1 Tax=Novosphingobium sp. TaxID=1874826 RepID=UPI003BABBDFE
MSHSAHDLAAAFPEATARLHELKLSDAHFRNLSDTYYQLDKAIHRAETGIEPTSDEHLEDLKKQRLTVLDAVAEMVAD